ncbi:hypothetical protein PMIN04_010590 [Paraphaeosphaeria minitans]
MPAPVDYSMETWDHAEPYGPLNPPPPPPEGPQQSDAGKSHRGTAAGSAESNAVTDEHGHRLSQQRGRRPASSCPDAGGQGQQPFSSAQYPDYYNARPERARYRERSPQRSRSHSGSRGSRQGAYRSQGSRFAGPSPQAGHVDEGHYRSRPSSSPRWRSPSPRGSRRGDLSQTYPAHYEYDEHEYSRPHTERTHPQRQRSLTPVFVRERRISSTDVPETAYPLRAYTNYIADNHAAKRRNTSYNRHLPVFRNGDGKVNPSAYGSVLQYDFGLCYCTFRTPYMCEMGIRCPWRHHPLSSCEKQWIHDIAHGKGEHFVDEAVKSWATPDVPVPGHNMIEVMQQEQYDRRRG